MGRAQPTTHAATDHAEDSLVALHKHTRQSLRGVNRFVEAEGAAGERLDPCPVARELGDGVAKCVRLHLQRACVPLTAARCLALSLQLTQ
jgi:hypothetical protein